MRLVNAVRILDAFSARFRSATIFIWPVLLDLSGHPKNGGGGGVSVRVRRRGSECEGEEEGE